MKENETNVENNQNGGETVKSKISPGNYIFQRPFFEGLIFGGAYIRRSLCMEGNFAFQNWLG